MNLRATLDDLDVLVDESKPATKDLAPFFRALRPLVHGREPDDPRPARPDPQAGPGQRPDRPDAEAAAARADAPSVAFPRSIKALQKSQPVIEYIRPYTPDLAGWLTKFGQGAANYDANGHFARIQPIFNAFSLTSVPLLGQVLTPAPERDAPARASRPRQSLRCPGGATQPPPDGSAPWRDTDGSVDCDPRHGAPRPMRRIFAIAVVLGVGRRRRSCSASARPTTPARGYEVRAIFDNVSGAVEGEDVKIAGAKVGEIDELDVTPDKKAVVVLEIDGAGLRAVPRGRPLHDPAAVADRREVRRVRPGHAPTQPELEEIPDGEDGAGQAPAAARADRARRSTST